MLQSPAIDKLADLTYSPVPKPESFKLPRKRCPIFCRLLQSPAIDKFTNFTCSSILHQHGYNLKPESLRLPRERCPIFQIVANLLRLTNDLLQSVAIGKRTNLTCGSFIGSFQNKFSKSYFTLGDNFANLTYGSFASPKAYRYRESAARFSFVAAEFTNLTCGSFIIRFQSPKV